MVANNLAYYDTATITAVKIFIVQAPWEVHDGATTFRKMTLATTTFSLTTLYDNNKITLRINDI